MGLVGRVDRAESVFVAAFGYDAASSFVTELGIVVYDISGG